MYSDQPRIFVLGLIDAALVPGFSKGTRLTRRRTATIILAPSSRLQKRDEAGSKFPKRPVVC